MSRNDLRLITGDPACTCPTTAQLLWARIEDVEFEPCSSHPAAIPLAKDSMRDVVTGALNAELASFPALNGITPAPPGHISGDDAA